MKKQLVLSAAVITVVGLGLLTTQTSFAQTTTPQESLIQKLVDTFHLNKADVQKVFDQQKQQNTAKREANYEARLDKLVKDGKITEAQKTLIINKHKELETTEQADRANMKNLTPAERRAKMQELKSALEAWAKQNNIDVKYLLGMGMGMRGRWGPGMKK